MQLILWLIGAFALSVLIVALLTYAYLGIMMVLWAIARPIELLVIWIFRQYPALSQSRHLVLSAKASWMRRSAS